MAPGKSFPKLGLPAKQRPSAVQAAPKAVSEPAQEQPYAPMIYDLITQELQRADQNAANAVVLEAVMARIVSDDVLFRRIATQIMRKQCAQRIKKIRGRKVLSEAAS